jgi:ribosomal protein L17
MTMADFPTIDLQSQLIARGLNPSSPATTYVDFATQLAKNQQEQLQMEQNLARAKELTTQSRIETKQKTAAEAAGYNPELITTMTKEQAKKQVEVAVQVRKLKIEQKLIDEWYDALPRLVKSTDVDNFIDSLSKSTGGLSVFSYTKDTVTMKDPKTGVDRVYNVAVRRLDGRRTHLYDPQTGAPVYPDIVETAQEADKEEAQKILDRAEPQLAGAEARFTTARATRDIKNWITLGKEINVSNAPAARAIGQAAVNNMRADRALMLLEGKNELTKNEYDIIVSDLAAIFKGGVPDIVSLEHQRYGSLKSDATELMQYILSKPEEVNTPEIRNRLLKITREIKTVDNDIILNYMDSVGAGYEYLVQEDPKRFTRMVNAQLRNMKLPEVDTSVIENMEEKPLGQKGTDIDVHALGKALGLKKKVK